MSKARVVVSTFYTPSHARLLDQFVESILATGFRDGDLRIHEFPQECADASYMSPGWLDTMKRKVRSVVDDLASLDTGDILIHADCDVRWYRNPCELADDDLAESPSRWQWDGYVSIAGVHMIAPCAGLGMIRANDKGERIAYDWQERVEALPSGPYRHDQDVLCHLLHDACHPTILPIEWWGHAHPYEPMRGVVWTPSMPTPEPPYGLIAHHANWCFGVEHKLALLDRVARLVAQQEDDR